MNNLQVVKPNQPTNVTLEDLVARFLADQDVKESSRRTYKRQLRQFVRWLEATGRAEHLNTLQREDILAFKEALLTDGLSPNTVSGYITAVRRFFAWLETQKIYPDVTRGIKGAKKPRGFRKDTLTRGQIRQVLASIDRSTLEGKRDYALINLLVRTGIRTIEAARARIGDLRQEGGQAVLWVQRKGRDEKDDFVLLTDEAVGPIYEYLAARGDRDENAPLFASLSNRNRGKAMTTRSISGVVKRHLKANGLDSPRLTAHSLRHTAISLAVEGGASLQQAQAMAGHSDPKTTMIYFHNLDRIRAGAEKCIAI